MPRGSSGGFGPGGPNTQVPYSNRVAERFSRPSVQVSVRISLRLWLAVCLLGCLALPLIGQAQSDDIHITPREAKKTEPGPMDNVDPSLRTHTKPITREVDLVLVPVTITDPMNRLVTGLEKDNFLLTDNGQPQTIKHFSSEDAPISLGVIFDVSGSMADKIDKSRQAVVEFFRTANPQDEFFLITFSEKPEVLVDFTSSVEDIQNKLVYAAPRGRTALLDAIYLGMNRMRHAKYERKALLIISDGGDNYSRYSLKETRHMIEEANVLTYGIGIFDDMPVPLLKTVEERLGRQSLAKLTDASGGRTIPADDRRQIPQIAALISSELRDQYMLGYRPTTQKRDGKLHKIRVRLSASAALRHVYYREGYVAPQQ